MFWRGCYAIILYNGISLVMNIFFSFLEQTVSVILYLKHFLSFHPFYSVIVWVWYVPIKCFKKNNRWRWQIRKKWRTMGENFSSARFALDSTARTSHFVTDCSYVVRDHSIIFLWRPLWTREMIMQCRLLRYASICISLICLEGTVRK